ncbi:MAG: zf-HC2 domain-containing protein, partial [Gemmatimonadota bacterium]|nr:zf-HC2 domain-containing protein [Gemmatimonadota bacterium]
MSEHVWREHASAFALGALDPDERDAFEAHLETCEECRAAVAEHARALDRLAPAVPEITPPSALKGRVLGAIGAEGDSEQADVVPMASRRGAGSRMARLSPWLAAAGFGFAIWAGLAYRGELERADALTADLA